MAAPGIESVTAAENSVNAALDTAIIQESLRDQVVATAIANGASLASDSSNKSVQSNGEPRDYRPLALSGVKTVVEVALIRVSTVGKGFNPPLQLQMTARVRLIRTSDNAEFFSYDYDYFSKEELKFDEWSSNHSERLLQALQVGYKSIGKDIYENIHDRFPDHKL